MTTQSNGNNLLVQGRLVWTIGSGLFEGKQKTDYNTKQPLMGRDGQPKVEYGFGLAIPKVDPRTGQNSEEFVKVWQTLHEQAYTIYPSGQLPPGFAMKFKDGDTDIDKNGKPYSSREGYPGHIILACTTQIPIKYFIFEGGNNTIVSTGIKNGDYVNVQLNVKGHPKEGNGNPGLYLNPSAVQLIQSGKEIINTPSGDVMFGQAVPVYNGQVVADQAPAMPGQAVPQTAPQMPGTTPTPVAPNPAMQPQAAPAMPGMPVQAAPAHYAVLPQTMQPAQAAPAMGNVNPAAPVVPGQAPVPTPQMNGGYAAPVPPSNGLPPAPAMPGMPVQQ